MTIKALWNWTHSTLHNLRGVLAVLDLMALRRLRPGLIPADHPWVTGVSPHTQALVWPDNIVFASTRPAGRPDLPSDDRIVTTLGRFLASMVKRSIRVDEIPHGPKRRMPHAVNYIHGTVLYNGLFVIFNDFEDAIAHMSDETFVREFKRVAREERREITIVLRDRNYLELDYAFFMGFVRSTLPWYANGNGPRKKVFYGGVAGFPAINTINGSWITDMNNLRRGKHESLVRPPVNRHLYFQRTYRGERTEPSRAERVFAWCNYQVVRFRGAQGGLVFTRREKIEPSAVSAFLKTGRIDAGADWVMPSLLTLVNEGFVATKGSGPRAASAAVS
jgi:hypothetical protein